MKSICEFVFNRVSFFLVVDCCYCQIHCFGMIFELFLLLSSERFFSDEFFLSSLSLSLFCGTNLTKSNCNQDARFVLSSMRRIFYPGIHDFKIPLCLSLPTNHYFFLSRSVSLSLDSIFS